MGPLLILEGPKQSKVPYSRSLFINGREKVLIDSGATSDSLLQVNKEMGIQLIVNTHYHPDHTFHNHLFPKIEKWINPIEFATIQSVESVARVNGIYQEWGDEGVKKWQKTLPQEWVDNLSGISKTYEYETEYHFGDVKVNFLHIPGHTSGLACPYFPEIGVAFVTDYDMTSFGPWYNGVDGDIDDFITSGERLLTLDADTYITGHQKGIFTKAEFKQAMDKFLAVIDRRDESIDRYIRQGLSFEELTEIGIFYPKKSLESFIYKTWERSGIRKHLERLGYTISKTNKELVKAK